LSQKSAIQGGGRSNQNLSLRAGNIRIRGQTGGPLPFSQSPSLGALGEAKNPTELPARPR